MNTSPRIANASRLDSRTSDDALLAAIAAGDRSAVAILYARHAAALRAAAVGAVGRHDETIADDAVADLFVSLLDGRASTFRPALGTPLKWLKGIARAIASEHLRGRTSACLKKRKRRVTANLADAGNANGGGL
jgi:DNA-directed RNA polymerase specialized sigma24 family protein